MKGLSMDEMKVLKPAFTSLPPPQTPFHGHFQLQAFFNSQVHGQYSVHQVRCQPEIISSESILKHQKYKLYNFENDFEY